MVKDIYSRHKNDPLTGAWFGKDIEGNIRSDEEIEELVFTFFSAGIGGPYEYDGRSMEDTHRHMTLTPTALHALEYHVLEQMEKHRAGGATERAEVLAILKSLEPLVLEGTNDVATE